MKKTNKKGFTIVELVIVIAVIAILAAVLIPTFSGVVARANQSAAQQLAMTAVKSSLLMVSTAALPDGTFILINSSKNPKNEPDYGYTYDGNALSSNPVKLKSGDVFDKANLLNKSKYSILVNSSMLKDFDSQVSSSGAVSQEGNLFNSMLQFVNLINSQVGSNATVVKSSGTNNSEVVIAAINSVQYEVYTSPDIPGNVIVFVPLD